MTNLDQYVIGTGIIIVIVAWMVGPGGAASTLIPDEDVGPNGTDFNTSRLSFQPEFPQPPNYDTDGFTRDDIIANSSMNFNGSVLSWDGTTNDQGSDEGYVIFNVTDRDDNIALELNDASGFFQQRSIGFFLTDSDNNTFELQYLEDVELVDLSGETYNGYNIERFEIKIINQDSTVDISGTDVTGETGFFDSIIDFIQFAYSSVVEIFSLLRAYVEFALLLPAGIGYIVLGYIGIMVAYLLFKEGWIG